MSNTAATDFIDTDRADRDRKWHVRTDRRTTADAELASFLIPNNDTAGA